MLLHKNRSIIFLSMQIIDYAPIVKVAMPLLRTRAVAYLDRMVKLGVNPSGYGCNTAGTYGL